MSLVTGPGPGFLGEEARLAHPDVGSPRVHGRQPVPDPAAHREQSNGQSQPHRVDPADSVRRADRWRLLHLPGET